MDHVGDTSVLWTGESVHCCTPEPPVGATGRLTPTFGSEKRSLQMLTSEPFTLHGLLICQKQLLNNLCKTGVYLF